MGPIMAEVVQMLKGVVELDNAALYNEFLYIAGETASVISTPSAHSWKECEGTCDLPEERAGVRPEGGRAIGSVLNWLLHLRAEAKKGRGGARTGAGDGAKS